MYVCMLIAVWQPPLLCSVSTAIQAALCLSCRKKHNKHDAAGPSSCYLLLCSLVLQIREMLLCRVYGPLAQIYQCVRELGLASRQDSPDGYQPCYLASLATWSSGNTEEVK